MAPYDDERCGFCGEEDGHRRDCPGMINLFPAWPGLLCDRCGQQVGDVFCMDTASREGCRRAMEVLLAGRELDHAIPLCVGCRVRGIHLDGTDPWSVAPGCRWGLRHGPMDHPPDVAFARPRQVRRSPPCPGLPPNHPAPRRSR